HRGVRGRSRRRRESAADRWRRVLPHHPARVPRGRFRFGGPGGIPEYILPYVEFGAGYKNSDFGAVSDAEESNNDAFVLVLGMGAKYFLADNTALNAGLFYQWASEDVFLDEGDPDDNQFLIRVGLNFYY
ncbi:MAG: outer membrane beta-barrel protein, partial [Verrucomicrobiota bacterium]|nr:outer membrane beta-barrel protein [Verrucomicrobiota bacterium]